MCLDPIVEPDQLEYRYQEMADANFTLVPSGAWMSPGWTHKWSNVTRMRHEKQALAAAEKAGLAMLGGVMPSGRQNLPKGTDPFDNATGRFVDANASLLRSDSPALWGYDLSDEPYGIPDLIHLKRMREAIDRNRPGKLSFVNLLPNYGFPRGPWATYDAYLDYYIAENKPQVISFDHYP